MKAVVFHEYGGRDVLRYEDVETPQPGPAEVRIRVKAVGLNHLDVWTRRGIGRRKLPLPHILGADVAGVVDAGGGGVDASAPGDEVIVNPGVSCGVCRMCLAGKDNLCREYRIIGEHRAGGYAEYIVVPQQNILRRPQNLSFEESAAFPLTFLTAWQMVSEKLEVNPGHDVLVMAASSGLSTAAIQIAKLFGARVIATSSSREKLEHARRIGSDETVLYNDPGWSEEVKNLTDGKGADRVVDHTGARFWEDVIKATAWGGRIAVAGASSGYEAVTPMAHIFYRQISILGSTMGSKSHLHALLPFVERGLLKPVVDRVLDLEDAAEGHRILEDREVIGKVVLRIGSGGG